jgi:cobaltochelatase CobN
MSAFRGLCSAHDVQLVLNTTAFAALGQGAQDHDGQAIALAGDAPVLQVIVSGGNREDWLADSQGLRPRDIAMQIALPEMDGRIITRAVSFKGLSHRCELTQTEVVSYQPEPDRIAFVAELARRWCRLRSLPVADKRIALILANYPGSEGRIGSGVGLDTPASVIGILRAMQAEGYGLGAPDAVPEDGDALMRKLQQGIANDPEQWASRPAWQSYALADYNAGRSNVLKWMKNEATTNSAAFVERIGFPSTQAYVRAVMERRDKYAEQGKKNPEPPAPKPGMQTNANG